MSPTTEQAIDWFVRLDGGAATETDRRAFAQWLTQADAHRQAWDDLQARLQTSVAPALHQLRERGTPVSRAGRQALLAPTTARRRVLGGGIAAVLAATTGWLAHRHTPLGTLAADLRTGTGERLHHTLPDGSELTLDARSAVDLDYAGPQRLVQLRAGALIASVVREAAAPGIAGRPFLVQSNQGTVQALGTRFMVRQEDSGHTFVHVMEHSVRITTRAGHTHTLQASDSARFDDQHITPLGHPHGAPAAWSEGRVDVLDTSLGEVIDALRPYLPGLVRVSPEAARLRIFGIFPLDRPDQVLQDLVDTQPVSVRRWGTWLTLVDLRANNAPT